MSRFAFNLIQVECKPLWQVARRAAARFFLASGLRPTGEGASGVDIWTKVKGFGAVVGRSFDEMSTLAREVGALYVARFGIVPDEAFFLGKLAEELGELSAAVLKLSGRSRGAESPLAGREANLRDEMADLLGFLLMFAAHRGIDLGAAFQAKWGRWRKE